MNRVCFVGSHGGGDCLLALQCANYVPDSRVLISTRDEVFRAIEFLFPRVTQIDERFSQNNALIKDELLIEEINDRYGPFDEIYYVIPDLLFNNHRAFDWRKYGVHPQTIKKTRLLLDKRDKVNKVIYVGLQTSTPNYDYPDINGLLTNLGERFPDYQVVFPKMNFWAGMKIDCGDFHNLPGNVYVLENPDFLECLELLRTAEYGIFTCNGVSHFAYHWGVPRLLLDPQFGRWPWMARWKEDTEESVPLRIPPSDVVRLVEINLRLPQSCLIPRMEILNNLNNPLTFFAQNLLLKRE